MGCSLSEHVVAIGCGDRDATQMRPALTIDGKWRLGNRDQSATSGEFEAELTAPTLDAGIGRKLVSTGS